ncbi:carbamoyl-phosphate synthase large subunit [Hippea sp. KM1]|uniref:carbamoyl-phosphate synthase large subunit n=1 Tax=Hippea sp. KM1 TaxID=944481 RepID=UPI00046D16FC|nr:carbamoyl-phosphate synthase large subunit [Hippea sp. KM1]
MPKRTDLKKIMIIGSGPIVIGQACEFDYSGTQACKALKNEGYEIVLVNSNPATIMTDPMLADRTYIEPITVDFLEKIIEKERPDAILPTLGGQTALNAAMDLYKAKILDKYGVELIGANAQTIERAEDRELFKKAMDEIGLKVPASGVAHNLKEAWEIVNQIHFPVIIRPSFTLGGTGAGVAYNKEEFEEVVKWGLEQSPVNEVLIEQSVLGWKEFELEVMRDKKDNVFIICSIENFDPMGVHTGDSITVAPAQTLTDKEYQILRDAAIDIIRKIGVETGGSNIQFAVNPENGEFVVIEMNPRVSRSSALASKATGFPIAKFAALLSVGYTLDEIPNDITKKTPASFEPVLDYVVVKIPRFTFEKFNTPDELGTQMKSVGEVMAIGRTFKEAFQKAIRSLEYNWDGFVGIDCSDDELRHKLIHPNSKRFLYVAEAFRRGYDVDYIYELTYIDRWFLHNIKQIVEKEEELKRNPDIIHKEIKTLKQYGFSDSYLASITGKSELEVRDLRKTNGCINVYKMVDTCSAEFEAYTPYFYSTYEDENESIPSNNKKVMILGSGPNRIGQGIEFDYTCVHGSLELRNEGYESIMVNCNPETVSTDYDISNRLYFEPLVFEDVMNIIENEKPEGVIVQFGGQTPLKLSLPLKNAGVKILGTDPKSIDIAEDRELFRELINKLKLLQPESGIAHSKEEAIAVAARVGYPVLVRPSYVLGGRAMMIIFNEEQLKQYVDEAVEVSGERPLLVDKFLEDAIEVDVDAVSDGEDTVVAAVMEHIEAAGIHSGDSACSIPPRTLKKEIVNEIKRQTRLLAKELNVKGLINIQFAVKNDRVYILEVNPRASRTVPFVSKATGVHWAKIATQLIMGKKIRELGIKEVEPKYYAVKESVFPFVKFPNVDITLGPEMRSTGEVMGIADEFPIAYYKALLASGMRLPQSGNVFMSLSDRDKPQGVIIASKLLELGFDIFCTRGTYEYLKKEGVDVKYVKKLSEGRPNILDKMKNNNIHFLINTPSGKRSRTDSFYIRRTALVMNIPYCTTISGAIAAVRAIEAIAKGKKLDVVPIQDYYRRGGTDG